MIAALYVETNGVYYGLPDVDPWDEARDARLYDGPWPVVAHPPCQRWCQLAYLIETISGYRVGDDGGTFAAALDAVRRFGGVLEHPAYSYAWPAFGLPRPVRGVWTSSLFDDGWVSEVDQVSYGHTARKRTWLYAVDCDDLPRLELLEVEATEEVSGFGSRTRRALYHGSSAKTPVPFRELLLGIARSTRPPRR